jgi:hypothetical protein
LFWNADEFLSLSLSLSLSNAESFANCSDMLMNLSLENAESPPQQIVWYPRLLHQEIRTRVFYLTFFPFSIFWSCIVSEHPKKYLALIERR